MFLYLIRYAEIGKEPHPEKKKLEKDIIENLKVKIKKLKIEKEIGRIFLATEKDEVNTLKQIHGIASFSPCIKCSLEDMENRVLAYAGSILKGKKSFALKVKRVGDHPFTSHEKASELGENILRRFPYLRVDLRKPEEMIFIEIRGEKCYLFNAIIAGIDKNQSGRPEIITEPRFIVDDMLGKLAVRLRMLGFDTTFYHDTADSFLLRKSREEGRILLTRDLGLTLTRGANALFIKSKKLKDQIRQVVEKYALKFSSQNFFSRCSVCNTPLVEVEKEKAKEKIPPLIYQLFEQFSFCPHCGKYYWKGTHYEKMLDEMGGLLAKDHPCP
jgi:hypothetical protein